MTKKTIDQEILEIAYLARVISQEDYEGERVPDFISHENIEKMIRFITQISRVQTDEVSHVIPFFKTKCHMEKDLPADEAIELPHVEDRCHGYYTVQKIMKRSK